MTPYTNVILTSKYQSPHVANLVLHLTVERIYVGKEYGEIDRGVFLIRGENVVLCGEVEGDECLTGFTKKPIEVILAQQAATAAAAKKNCPSSSDSDKL